MILHKDIFDSSVLQQDVYKFKLSGEDDLPTLGKELQAIMTGMIAGFIPVQSNYSEYLEERSFHLISVRTTYRYRENETKDIIMSDTFTITPFAQNQEIEEHEIKSLAQTIGQENRYYKDTKIPTKQSQEIYIQWINNSLYRGFASQCFLARDGKRVVGITTTKIKGSEGEIDLVGVLPQYRHKSVGKKLLIFALRYMQSNQILYPTVVTAAENIRANAFFQRNGFRVENVELVYHKHY